MIEVFQSISAPSKSVCSRSKESGNGKEIPCQAFSDRKRGTFAYLFAFSKELKYLLIVAVSLMVSSSRKCLRLIKII